MEEIENAFDHIYKVCAACGQSRTLRNYRLNEKTKVAEGSDIRNIFSPICKCCEAHPNLQLKSNRLALLREKMVRYRANEMARLEKIKKRELDKELAEMKRQEKPEKVKELKD